MIARALLAAAVAAMCLASPPVAAQASGPGVTGDYTIAPFRFASGETLPALRIHYRTLGTPRRDAAGAIRNAVLILHGTGGTGDQFLSPAFAGALYGAGQPLDTTRFYLVLPDGIGHGRSSRPSEGLHARFPHYTYDDMVEAERRLVTKHLGVAHLRLVMGTSMGGMHSWIWGERHNDLMDGLVPLTSVPTQIAGRNRMMRRMVMDDIRLDPEWKGGEYTRQPPGLRAALEILFLMGSAPLVQHREAPTRDAADSLVRRWMEARLRTTDANDMLYAFDASRDYDPSGALERISAPLLAINSADDAINPPELGLMERLIPRVRHGRYVLLPAGPATRGHGTHTIAALWKDELAAFMQSLPPLPPLH